MRRDCVKKTGRGGPRPNSGRPKKAEEDKKPQKPTRSITFNPVTLAQLDAFAEAEGMSRSAAVERLIVVGLEVVKQYPLA